MWCNCNKMKPLVLVVLLLLLICLIWIFMNNYVFKKQNNGPRMGCPHEMMSATQSRATRLGHMETGGSLTSRPPSHPRWHANDLLSPFLPYTNHASHTIKNLQVFMALHDDPSLSPQLQWAVISSPLSTSLAHFYRSDLLGAHSILRSALQLWCDSSIGVLELFGAYPPF